MGKRNILKIRCHTYDSEISNLSQMPFLKHERDKYASLTNEECQFYAQHGYTYKVIESNYVENHFRNGYSFLIDSEIDTFCTHHKS